MTTPPKPKDIYKGWTTDKRIEEYHKLNELTEGIIAQLDVDHDRAYIEAHDRLFGKKSAGGIRYSTRKQMMKTKEGRDKFLDVLAESYLDLIKDNLSKSELSEAKKNPVARDLHLHRFYEVTRGNLSKEVHKYRERYDRNAHDSLIKAKHIETVTAAMQASAYEPLEKINKVDALKKLTIKDKKELEPYISAETMNHFTLGALLNLQKEQGEINKKNAVPLFPGLSD